jgi:PhzF family phenazine biosynthesis protein
MKEFKFKKIDAFATDHSDGNPAGYIALNYLNDITEAEMLQIAREMKGFVNEVGYVAQTGQREFDLRYYSSEREVNFCGHATIAILYDLIKTKPMLSEFPTVTIRTNKGVLTVFNHIQSEDSVYIMAPLPIFREVVPEEAELTCELGISSSDIDSDYPVEVINAGLTTLIVPVKKLETILGIQPQLEALKAFCLLNNIDIVEVFTKNVSCESNDYRARVFAPTFGYIEDPATGSGNSAFGYYLMKNNRWNDGMISIEQNGLREMYNVVKLRHENDEQNRRRVCFGGAAVTRIDGFYRIY